MYCTKCGKINSDEARFCKECGFSLQQFPAKPDSNVNYAGFWKRFGAAFIDGIIITVIDLVIYFVLAFFLLLQIKDPFREDTSYLILLYIIYWIISILVGWIYNAGFESSNNQATPGKMALGIIVTDIDGKRISFGRATGRHFSKIISAITLGIGFLMIGFTEKKQGLHDIIAGCKVVVKR